MTEIMTNTIVDLVIQGLIGFLTAVATVVIAWYAKVQSDFIKFQTRSRYTNLKDWIFERIIEQNVDELENTIQRTNIEVNGGLTLNELFEDIPNNLWDTKWKGQKRKRIFLKILVELSHEGYIQNFFAEPENAKRYSYHGFGEGAVGFAYYDYNNVNKEMSKSINQLSKKVEELTRKLNEFNKNR